MKKRNKETIKNQIPFYLLIMVISGIFGFIYETIFYRIDLGYFVKRGTTLGPWIPIYAFGGLLISLTCYKYKDKPFKLFILSMLISGTLEFSTGYILFHYYNIRLWDYNTEIWNYLNIGGYVCLRSILFFGISGIFLIKAVIPSINIVKRKIPEKFTSVAYTSGFLLIADIVLNSIFHIFK